MASGTMLPPTLGVEDANLQTPQVEWLRPRRVRPSGQLSSDLIIGQDPVSGGIMRYNPSVTEVARNFADYINRVAFRG